MERSEISDVDLTDTELTPHQLSQAKELSSEFSDVFSQNDRDYGRTNLITHSIKTENIRKTPYRLPQAYREAGEKQIQEMFEDYLIEPSTSPWCAPVVMARKKDGSLRFCTDVRGLNAATITDAHPLHRVDDSIDKLAGSTIFSCLDLSSGYWQVELDSGDKEKTAFSLGNGLW